MSYNYCSVHENMFLKKCSVCEYELANPKCSSCNHRSCICDTEVYIEKNVRRNAEIEHLDMGAWNKRAKKSNSRISKRFAHG